jgi:hypothetical protein
MKYLFLFFALVIAITASAQININLSPVGMSHLTHKADYRSSPSLYNLYRTIALTHDEYSWEQFLEDFDMKRTYQNFNYGIMVKANHKTLPLYVAAGVASSPSSINDFVYSVGAGVGKRKVYGLYARTVLDYQFGISYVKDTGFGRNTIVNSIGNKSIRDNVDVFFVDAFSDRHSTAYLLSSRLYFGYKLSTDFSCGIYGAVNVDLTDSLKRAMRMNTVTFGLNLQYHFERY